MTMATFRWATMACRTDEANVLAGAGQNVMYVHAKHDHYRLMVPRKALHVMRSQAGLAMEYLLLPHGELVEIEMLVAHVGLHNLDGVTGHEWGVLLQTRLWWAERLMQTHISVAPCRFWDSQQLQQLPPAWWDSLPCLMCTYTIKCSPPSQSCYFPTLSSVVFVGYSQMCVTCLVEFSPQFYFQESSTKLASHSVSAVRLFLQTETQDQLDSLRSNMRASFLVVPFDDAEVKQEVVQTHEIMRQVGKRPEDVSFAMDLSSILLEHVDHFAQHDLTAQGSH